MTQKSNRALRGRRRTRRKGKSSSNGFRSCKLSLETLEQRQLLSVNPIISEFMASNSTTLKDYYGKYPDWLEIYNPDTAALNFSGWKLKDNSTVWTIPANVTIPAEGYLKVFCDNRDTVAPNGELHTNFKLGASGDYLGLLAARQHRGFGICAAISPAIHRRLLRFGRGAGQHPDYLVRRQRQRCSCRRPPTAAARWATTWQGSPRTNLSTTAPGIRHDRRRRAGRGNAHRFGESQAPLERRLFVGRS